LFGKFQLYLVLLIKEQLAKMQVTLFFWKGRIMIYTKKLKTITLKVKEEPALENASNSKTAYEIAKNIYRSLSDDQEHF